MKWCLKSFLSLRKQAQVHDEHHQVDTHHNKENPRRLHTIEI